MREPDLSVYPLRRPRPMRAGDVGPFPELVAPLWTLLRSEDRLAEQELSRPAACPPTPVFVDCPPPGTPFETLDRFRFDQAGIVPDRHLPLIRRIATAVVASQRGPRPITTVLIAGHTDPAGPDDYNFALSRRRAEAVLRALCSAVERLKPGLSRRIAFQLTPCGERQAKSTPEQSRRVEIFLFASGGAKPRCACTLSGDRQLNAWLQRSLNKALGLRLMVNGTFDTPTRSALRSFATRRGLPPASGVTPAVHLALVDAGAEPAPCAVVPCEPACDLFLAAINSKNYEDYVRPRTTGRLLPLINGRSSGGTGPDIDNTEAFDQMQRMVETLKKGDSVYLAAWQFDPNIALTASSTTGIKTWGELFRERAKQGVKIRILVTEYDPLTPFFKQLHNQYLPALDKHIDELPAAARDNLQYVVSAHPATYLTKIAGSHHQKFMVLLSKAGTTAFCGGLDIAFLRTPPYWSYKGFISWHDIHSRMEGLIARDLEREFVLRWNREKAASRVKPHPGWKGLAALVESPVKPADRAKDLNGHKLQMLRTVSVQGRGFNVQQTKRDDIWQVYLRMISCANDFLYFENQYFREPLLADALVKRAKQRPELIIIIVVPSKLDDAPDMITEHGRYLQYQFFSRLYAGLDAKRLRVYTMFSRIIHSKFALADDRAIFLGSANANPRGFQLDSELNVLMDDQEASRKFRARLWAHNLGETETAVAAWKTSDFIAKWDAIAGANQKLASKPGDMAGEGIVPFDYKTFAGSKSRLVPDVLTEVETLDAAAPKDRH